MNKYFLATTAIEESWDIEKPMVFLGEWCQLYSRRLFIEQLDYRVMSSPFQNLDDSHNAYVDINNICEKIIPDIVSILNKTHDQNYSLRYWNILVGPWLRVYIAVVYDRFMSIEKALEDYPDFSTITLSKSSFVTHSDSLSFNNALSKDLYNFQIYSKILSFYGRVYPSIKITDKKSKLKNQSWKSKIENGINFLYKSTFLKLFPPFIVFKDSYFSRKTEFNFFLFFFGRVFLCRGMNGVNANIKPRKKTLDRHVIFKGISFGEDDFSKCLASMISLDMPKSFLENYESIRKISIKKYPKKTKIIFSANAWYYDEFFKFWAAECAEKKTILLGTPHGADYGIKLDMFNVKIESEIVDYYYSWGWRGGIHSSNIIPMPATKLVNIKRVNASNDKNGILWVTTTYPRYLVEPFTLPRVYKNYIEWILRFSRSLSQGTLAKIRIRPHYQDHDWFLMNRLKDSGLNIDIESWDTSLGESLESCRLYVCDHLSTTFSEALSANIPTILFLDVEHQINTPEAELYLNLLRDCGIIMNSPEEAAEEIDKIYTDVELWWNAPVRKRSVKVFCDHYCRTSDNAIDLWSNELLRVIKKTKY